MKQLWQLIVTNLGGLETPVLRLLFTVLVIVILFFYIGFRDANKENSKRSNDLEKQVIELNQALKTQGTLYQDKIDQCNGERLNDLKKTYEHVSK